MTVTCITSEVGFYRMKKLAKARAIAWRKKWDRGVQLHTTQPSKLGRGSLGADVALVELGRGVAR
jgi:hypothetical protein